jgi:hypothetical protein
MFPQSCRNFGFGCFTQLLLKFGIPTHGSSPQILSVAATS